MLGTSASSSTVLSTAMRNNGSGDIGDELAPTIAVLRVMTPAAGARKVALVAAPAPGPGAAGRLTRASA
jgi:hypothetical protein